MPAAKAAYSAANLDFGRHAVAITGTGSKLDKFATKENWLLRLPMWDWVGGRTSETGPVGLLPAALRGSKWTVCSQALNMDAATRETITASNPAMLLALMWYHAATDVERRIWSCSPTRINSSFSQSTSSNLSWNLSARKSTSQGMCQSRYCSMATRARLINMHMCSNSVKVLTTSL